MPMPTLADVKVLPWIAAPILIAVLAWTNPTKFDHYDAIAQLGPGPFQKLQDAEDNLALLGLAIPLSVYSNYIVFSTLKLPPVPTLTMLENMYVFPPGDNVGQSILEATISSPGWTAGLTIGFLGKVFVIRRQDVLPSVAQ